MRDLTGKFRKKGTVGFKTSQYGWTTEEHIQELMTRLDIAGIRYYLTPKAEWIYFPWNVKYPALAELILNSRKVKEKIEDLL